MGLPVRGVDLLPKLCEALGLSWPVQKVVIECDVRGPVRVYVQGFPDHEAAEKLRGVLAVIEVGEVTGAWPMKEDRSHDAP